MKARKEKRVRTERLIPRPKTLNEYVALFTKETIPHVKIGRRCFYDPHNLLQYARNNKMDPYSVGLFLGEERDVFQPTSALINLIAERSDKKVKVNDKAAWLYLCNRDVLMTSVLDPNEQEPNTNVIVMDTKEQVIGAGLIVTDFDSKMKNKVFIKHRIDKGEYLRREK